MRIEAAPRLFNQPRFTNHGPPRPHLSPRGSTTIAQVNVPSHATLAAPAPDATWRRWLPNALTGLRLVFAAAFFVMLAAWHYPARELVVTPKDPVWRYLVAALLFGLAALTDALDGPLARRWKVVSKFGRVMDPFADKVLVVGAFVMLAGPTFVIDHPTRDQFQVSGVQSWMVVIILGRELLVTSIRAVMEGEGKDFSASWSGKAKMILQACVIPFILVMLGISDVRPGQWGRYVVDAAVWTTVVVTVLSGVPYVTRGLAALSERR
jgi:CDP-diacylglycerol--glycerol-3-phosphate 3-phosphatidyltransferase